MPCIPGYRLKVVIAIVITVTLTTVVTLLVDANVPIHRTVSEKVSVKHEKQIEVTSIRSFPTETDHKRSTSISIGSVIPTIFVVTPTYTRPVQKAELTNMCNLLSHVRNVRWLVVEDSVQKTDMVKRFLARCKVTSVHLNVKSKRQPERTIPQRNLSLDWIRKEVERSRVQGVVYFADDDNTYDPQVFEEMRYTKKISVWPVGLSGNVAVETAIVQNGTVVDWLSSFQSRQFAIDMAGFAINVKLLVACAYCNFCYSMGGGYMETQFIEQFDVPLAELEPKADNCTKVLVWHTQRVKPNLQNAKFGKDRNYTIPAFDV